ncbi:G-protein coupled receptor 87-like [Ictalurus furcatus]|uniref:G-protein coupled receptor 87-like n=1 Tax=Ictalurus furcatus TaxID=66913 RepID=UPI0023502FBE|nr:G-protein coupled receptor 87-like [Ictalurus furcatus]XP_053507453.1 G-protein coupled receptor 87-like [Ictalurus furcatus]XP_053507454.1 G-protein coupled receptor 87-like [Ictalurus furcatus]XP_053507455.1 G-protein coupled receptor 87-like [Ictalurus furcatus]
MDLSNQQGDPLGVWSIVFVSLYLLVFVAGLLLNSMAVWVFFQIRTQKRTFMLYLRNMAVADLFMTLTLPINILTEAKVASSGLEGVSCRYTAVLFYCCMYASILFLGLVALDRYLKIVRPFGGTCGACLYSYSFTVAMAVMVWLVMIALSLPNVILTDKPVTKNMTNCAELKSEVGKKWHGVVIYMNILIFFLVLITLLTCYISIYRHIHRSSSQFIIVGETTQRKAKKGQNILVLLVVFFICFVPYHLCRIPFTKSQTDGVQMNFTLLNGKKATLLLSMFNVCLDPIIYFLMCKSFRSKLSQTLGFWTVSDNMSMYTPTSTRKTAVVMRFKESTPA